MKVRTPVVAPEARKGSEADAVGFQTVDVELCPAPGESVKINVPIVAPRAQRYKGAWRELPMNRLN